MLAFQSADPAFAEQDAESLKASGGENESGDNRSEGENETSEEEDAKQSFWARFKDPEDGKFDLTAGGGEETSGVLPLVIPFNEPAVGFGVIAGGAYFHPDKRPPEARGKTGKLSPPSTTFAGGFYTDNDSWGVAGGHMGVWNQGRTKYLGALFLSSLNLDFYGIGKDPEKNENPIPFNLETWGTSQKIEFKIGKSDWFIGTKYIWATVDTTPDPESGQKRVDTTNAGLSVFATYDSRDNIFTPNRGLRAQLNYSYFAEALGGDFDYGRLDLTAYQYWQLVERVVFGARFEFNSVGEDAPFYALPFVTLRGIPAFRYLGDYVVVGEVEPRWKVTDRWHVVAFAGVGRAAKELDELDDAEKAYSFGTGFRYLIARKLGLAVGLDVARGPEDTVLYITFGSAWLRL